MRGACHDRRIELLDVKPMPGLEHLPYAEVWFRTVDERSWLEASTAAHALEKGGLEVWTTDETPEVVAFLAERGYEEVRRYVVSLLDVDAAPDSGPPGIPLVTFAERPDLAPALFEIALECYPDQPGRAEQHIESYESWRQWGLDSHPADAFFVALDGGTAVGYGFVDHDGGAGETGFLAVARRARGRGIASAIKRGEIAWAKEHGVRTLRTANETRLAGMLALNRRLGFRPLYEEIVLRGPAAAI